MVEAMAQAPQESKAKPRGFPVATPALRDPDDRCAAGAGGYFAWTYRAQALRVTDDQAECTRSLGAVQATSGSNAKLAGECKTALDAQIVKAGELEKQTGELAKNMSATKEELAQLRAQKAEADQRIAAIEEIQKQFAKMIDTGQLSVSARHGELVVSLPSEVLFPSGSAVLSTKGEYAVVEVAAVLKRFADRRFLVVGHTDTQDFAKPKAGRGRRGMRAEGQLGALDGARADRDARDGHRRHGLEEPDPGRCRRARSGRAERDARRPPEESPDRDRAVARDQRAATAAAVAPQDRAAHKK